MAEGKLPSCYGIHWDAAAPECARCLAASTCEGLTKAGKEEAASAPAEPETPAPEETPETPPAETAETPAPEETPEETPEEEDTPEEEPATPLEHFLKSLEGKYTKESAEDAKLHTHKFRDDGGKLRVMVKVALASGKVQVKTASTQLVVDGFESIEKAEEVLHEILG